MPAAHDALAPGLPCCWTVVLSVVLKVVRLAQVPATGPRPADLVSDLTFSAAWIVGWWVLAVAGSRRLTRALVLAAAQLSTWAWSVLVVYHEYWMRTGNTLTLDRLMATWRGRHDLSGLLGTQLTAGTLALLAGATLGCTVLPTVLGRARSRRAGSMVGPSLPGADHPAARLPTGRSLGGSIGSWSASRRRWAWPDDPQRASCRPA
jgi:hypothetical protein